MTILEQIKKQLNKLINVIKVLISRRRTCPAGNGSRKSAGKAGKPRRDFENGRHFPIHRCDVEQSTTPWR